jgi:hypothetical protein
MDKRRTGDTMVKRRTSDTMVKRRTGDTMIKRRTGDTMVKRRTGDTMVKRRTGDTMVKRKRLLGANNDLQNITHKTKDRVTSTPPKPGGELRCSGRVNIIIIYVNI